MRTYSDYRMATQKAAETLEDYDILQVPIDLKIIFDSLSNEIRLQTYRQYMEERHRTLKQTVADFESELGTCLFDPTTNRYLIYYNSSLSRELCRFTLAHELGHILLEHHIEAHTNLLSRSFLPKKVYKAFEREAEVFARNLLSPALLAKKLRMITHHNNVVDAFAEAFTITKSAAQVRSDKIKTDMAYYTDSALQYAERIRMQYQPMCKNCNHRVPMKTKFCPFCGSNEIRYSLTYDATPIITSEAQAKAVCRCPRCGNKEILPDANYCIICGLPLNNLCLGATTHSNPRYAKYCMVCGIKTKMGNDGVEIKEVTEKLMKYEDGVPYDSDTFRVKICPVCRNEEFSSNAAYCRICGADLHNRCDGIVFDERGDQYVKEQHANPSNARYCEVCGRPTLFLTNKILCEYNEYTPPPSPPENTPVPPPEGINWDDEGIPF